MSVSDHQKLHAGWLKTEGVWTHKPCTMCNKILLLSAFYPRKNKTPTAKCKNCHIKLTREWAIKNPERKKEIALKSYYKKKGDNHAR